MMFRTNRLIVVGLLLASFLALLLAPTQMPPSYDWLRHTTSESGAQGIAGAWLARLGFLLFGLAVLAETAVLRKQWSLPPRIFLGAFGVCMTAVAAFSARPWLPEMPFDPVEDWLHSFAATGMGFAFALGVGWRWWQRPWQARMRVADLVAVGASIFIPLAMSFLPDWDGLLQRLMFAVAYLWYGLELLNFEPKLERLS
ncbi:MAG: DUF998 domain-containing protein [Ardenticatenaceae bacterium]|nr:DUF998 domain-containing protein [Ardenticatenaceae bacterium]